MKTEFQINFDYNRTMTQVRTLRETAQELRTLANRDMQNNMAHISQNWSGDNANKYIRKEATVADSIKRQADQLINIADTMERAARRIQKAELDALHLAQRLAKS